MKSGGGTLLLASFSLAAIGFSSWIVISEISELEEKNVQIDVADVASAENGIFDNVTYTRLSICSDGAVSDETIVSKVDVSVNVTINRDVCGQYNFLSASSDSSDPSILKMRAKLTSNNSDFLNLLVGFDCNITPTYINDEPTDYTTQYSRILSLDLTEDKVNATFTYTFEDKAEDENGSYTYNYFKSYYNTGLSLSFGLEAIAP